MTTTTGFKIDAAVKQIISDPSMFSDNCRSHTCGTGSYQDEQFGEVSFQFEFSDSKLHIHFVAATLLCTCTDIYLCDCDDLVLDDFGSWSDYFASFYETVTLSVSKVSAVLQPNLFSQLK